MPLFKKYANFSFCPARAGCGGAANLQSANEGGRAGTRHPAMTKELHSTQVSPRRWYALPDEVAAATFLLFAMATS